MFLPLLAVALAIIAFVLVKSKKNYFAGTASQSSMAKDKRFEIRKGKSVFLKNYEMTVKFAGIDAPKISVDEHTARVVRLTVEKTGRSKELSFDANNLRATKLQEAFGLQFHLLDLRNNTAVLSVE